MVSSQKVLPDMMGTREYAFRTDQSLRSVATQIQEGTLPVPAFRIGNRWKISRAAYARWLAEVSGDEPPADDSAGRVAVGGLA